MINVVYTANTDVSCTVHYYKQGTTEQVAEDKILSGQIFDSTVTETAIDVTGYTADTQTGTLTPDAYDKAITFCYTPFNC